MDNNGGNSNNFGQNNQSKAVRRLLRMRGQPMPGMSAVAYSGAYGDLTGKPTLFSGIYADLTGKPLLFSGNYNDLVNKPVLFSGAYVDLTGKPVLFSGAYADLTGKPTIPVINRQETYAGNTDASGNFTVNFQTAYANVPDVQVQMVGASANQQIRIVSVSKTGFVAQVVTRNSLTVLTLNVLSFATSPAVGIACTALVTAK